MFMVVRVYHIPRLTLYHSSLWNDATTNFASLASFEITISIAVRAMFARFGVSAIIFFLIIPFVCLSFVFSNCERLFNTLYQEHHHALWASFVSLTTVGYGTDEAHTACGRGVSGLQILLGITGTSLLIAEIQNGLHMTGQQQQVMKMMAQKKRNREIRHYSVVLIQVVWRAVAQRLKRNRANAYLVGGVEAEEAAAATKQQEEEEFAGLSATEKARCVLLPSTSSLVAVRAISLL